MSVIVRVYQSHLVHTGAAEEARIGAAGRDLILAPRPVVVLGTLAREVVNERGAHTPVEAAEELAVIHRLGAVCACVAW